MTERNPGAPTEGNDPQEPRRSPADRSSGRPAERIRRCLLAILTCLGVLVFLKWSAMATLPLAFAIFLVVLLWPLQVRLERRLPRALAFGLTILALLAVFGAFFASLAWSGRQVVERVPEYADRIDHLVAAARDWAQGYGLALPAGFSAEDTQRHVRSAFVVLSSSLTTIGLILAFTVLGLFEVEAFHAKARHAFRRRRHGRRLIGAAQRIVERFQRYLWVRVLMAALTGLVVWLFSLVVGLDLAALWGLIAFLLNFVPTVGSVLSVIPPTLFALIQFEGWRMALVVLIGNAALQMFIGNWVDPRIEGRVLSLSPLVVLFSIVFWGWLWGIGGALLAVPIMVALAVVADESPETRWFAAMLAREAGPDRRSADRRVAG